MRGSSGWVVLLVALAARCSHDRAQPPPTVRFVERLEGSGVDFVHDHGGTGKKLFPEIVSGGASLLDYDGDGDLDLWFAQGGPLPDRPDAPPLLDRLYRNDGSFHFTDVTAESGAGEPGYSYGAACPDVDGDGDLDLYVCNYQQNCLLVNDGQGRFTDVTESSGLACPSWSVCAAFVDLDGDGDLDGYVGNYTNYDLAHPKVCGEVAKGPQWRTYCHPDNFPGARDELYRNDGGRDGAVHFTQVTVEAGIERSTGKALAVVPTDYDGDGDVDLYVANDHVPNFLWRNDTVKGGPIQLVDVAFDVGVAQDGEGRSESCMGSDAGDVDNDGDFDLFSANMAMETNTLYVNDGGLFVDDTELSGLGQDSFIWVGFGAKFFDQDLDGDVDLAIANGHVLDNVALYDPHQTFAQPAQLYENAGRGKFHLVHGDGGPYFTELHVGRGLAAGDLDNDGDTDLVFAHWGEKPQILENTAIHRSRGATGPSWIGLALKAKGANTQAIGARVECWSGGSRQVNEVRGAGSYDAWNDTRLVFGLGAKKSVDKFVIRWPDGTTQEVTGLAAGRYHTVAQP